MNIDWRGKVLVGVGGLLGFELTSKVESSTGIQALSLSRDFNAQRALEEHIAESVFERLDREVAVFDGCGPSAH